MKCLYEDEETKQCINPYCFYKGQGCPVKEHAEMCKLYYGLETRKTEEIVRNLRYCAEDNCGWCSMGDKEKCCNSLLEMAADELERLTREKE